MVAVAKKKAKAPKQFDGAKARELRTQARYTLEQLAELAGVSAADLSRYERGLVVPSFDAACRLADALGVKADDFRQSKGEE